MLEVWHLHIAELSPSILLTSGIEFTRAGSTTIAGFQSPFLLIKSAEMADTCSVFYSYVRYRTQSTVCVDTCNLCEKARQ